MRRHIKLLVLVILLCAFSGPASAHSPSDMQVTYDQAAGELVVTITHQVADPATHYIKEVEIQGTGARTESYSSQPTPGTFTYRYPLVLAEGDSVTVTARCSIGGSITREFTVPGPAVTDAVSPQQPSTLSYSMLWPFHAALMVTGFLCFLAAALLPVYGKHLQGWYRLHTRLSGAGAVITIIALGIAFAMVSISGGPNFRVPHAYLGLLIFIVLLLVLGLAFYRTHAPGPRKAAVRTFHLWLGRVLIILMAANIVAGLVLTGIL